MTLSYCIAETRVLLTVVTVFAVVLVPRVASPPGRKHLLVQASVSCFSETNLYYLMCHVCVRFQD